MHHVTSYQIADSIDLKGLKNHFTGEIVYSDSDELFFRTQPDQFVYIFKFGVISFYNCEEVLNDYIKTILPFCKNVFDIRLSDELLIETGAPAIKLLYNKIQLPYPEAQIMRFIMLNLSQSVALDHYSQVTNVLLTETNSHTLILEKKGKLGISGKVLKKYIGRTLNMKNRITENLYIFDSPDETWENEELNKIDAELKKNFDLQVRFRIIQDSLISVKENLELFKDILQSRNSTQLEWVVILLILVEVINLIVERFMTHIAT